jgi:hypothetical protein
VNIIWLASYPRSGNTLLRTILWHCFGLRSASVYRNDLGGCKALEDYVGHIEYGPDGRVHFPADGLPLVKTHEYPQSSAPAVYIVRDGRAASISLWNFYNRSLSLIDVVHGRHRFGTWTDHIRAWAPETRPNTLLLKYEDIADDLPAILDQLGAFLKREIRKNKIPPRNRIAGVDGRWVRKKSDWRREFPDQLLDWFNRENREMLKRLGYE